MELLKTAFGVMFFISPGIMAAFISEWLKSVRMTGWRFFAHSIIFSAVIGAAVCFYTVMRGYPETTFDSYFYTSMNIVKYCVASFILALVVPSAAAFIHKALKWLMKPAKGSHKDTTL